MSVKKLLYAIDSFVHVEQGLKYALSPLMLFEATALKVGCGTGEGDYDGRDKRVKRLEQLPQNMDPASRSVYVVDVTDPKSIWRGVKLNLDMRQEPLLSGVWGDVSVSFDAQRNYVLNCSEGAYWLIENKYKKILLAEIAQFYGGKVLIVHGGDREQSEIEQQLNALGKNVKFD